MLPAAPRPVAQALLHQATDQRQREVCVCGCANISNIAGAKYLEGDFVETNKNWQEEWFYIPDVRLEDPLRSK